MSVVKLVTLHVNVAYGLVPEAWVVEGAGAEALDIAVVAAAAAAAQDIGGAQAMAEGATAHGIVLLGSGVTVGLHLLVHGVPAGRLHLLVHGATAGRHHHRLRETTAAGRHRQPEN
jgi:hypothetical protein